MRGCMLQLHEIFSSASGTGVYRSLDSEKIIKTSHKLTSRISERFPKSGLSKVAEALHAETQEAGRTTLWLAKPLMIVRVFAGILIAFMMVLLVAAPFSSWKAQLSSFPALQILSKGWTPP
jgi:hypothetical protein